MLTTPQNNVIEKKLPVNFTPRSYQKKLLKALDSGIKRAVVVWPRRHGKDKTILNWCIKTIADGQPQICFYCLPELKHGRKVIWDAIDNSGFAFKNHFPKELIANLNNSDMKVTFTNGSIFQVVGSDTYDSLIGSNPKIVVFSEYGVTNPRAWDFLRPILDNPENKGTAIFIGTCRGKNHFYKLFKMAQLEENKATWFSELLTNDDTHLLSDDDFTRMRREGMSEELIQQEFFCSWEGLIEGSIYGNYLGVAEREQRICHVPYDINYLVHTAWDIGLDATAVTFFQLIGNEIHIIDHYETKNVAMIGSINEIKSRPYQYGIHFSPHDGRNRSVTTGSCFVDLAEQMGLNMEVIPNDKSIADGIEIVKGTFNRMFFDKVKCEYLISCLQSYHTEYDEKLQKYRAQPCHDWASHSSDSVRYMCLAIKNGINSIQGRDEWSNIKTTNNYYGNAPTHNTRVTQW